jgi:hypothetical protein
MALRLGQLFRAAASPVPERAGRIRRQNVVIDCRTEENREGRAHEPNAVLAEPLASKLSEQRLDVADMDSAELHASQHGHDVKPQKLLVSSDRPWMKVGPLLFDPAGRVFSQGDVGVLAYRRGLPRFRNREGKEILGSLACLKARSTTSTRRIDVVDDPY